MIKPDVIVTWPRNCDYPLWRQFIRDERHRFNEVIIIFMDPHCEPDYSQFVRGAMLPDRCMFVNSPPVFAGQDWRDVAVHAGLLQSYNAEWIWFTEMDFYVTEPKGFWQWTEDPKNMEAIGVMDGPRLHPCCLFLKRSTLEKTHKDFGVISGVSDHFSKIQNDLANLGVEVGVYNNQWYSHMAGVSHNFRLITEGQLPVYKPDEFYQYLADSLNVSVQIDPRFEQLARAVLTVNAPQFLQSPPLSDHPPQKPFSGTKLP